MKPELNPEIEHPAYLCGRLLAILENIQRKAIRGARRTIVDAYYGTASTAPASVFANLMRLAQSHLGKLRKTDAAAYFALQEDLERIAVPLGSEFPRTLSPVDQGKFALGYYQQRAADRAARAEAIAAREAEEQDETESPEEES